MDVLDRFFKKFSYKFPKGYPDINDEQDMLMLEGILEDLGVNFIFEKKLEWTDLSDATRKYARLNVIDDKIQNGIPFNLEDGTETTLQYTDNSYKELFVNQKVDDIKNIGGSRINLFPFFKTPSGKKIGFSDITKTRDLGGTEGKKAETTERQERGLVDLINSIKGPKTIISSDKSKITNVVRADKFEGQAEIGNEPYTDVILYLEDGTQLNVSAKGPTAPTLGSGGMKGIRALTKNGANPELLDFIKNFYDKAYEYYKKLIKEKGLEGQNLYKNKEIPDVSIKIPEKFLEALVKGTKAMGGPVDYYYIGSMDVVGTPEGNNIVIKNGDFISIKDFIDKKGDTLYAHIRKRDGDLYFTDKTQNLNGVSIPIIFMKNPKGRGRGAQSRFGMIDKIRGVDIS